MILFKILVYISMTLTIVSCHYYSKNKQEPNPFMSRQESSVFLYSKRNERSIDCDDEDVCEENKDYCMRESDRETYCTKHPPNPTCSSGQYCTLTIPCPRHFKTGCIIGPRSLYGSHARLRNRCSNKNYDLFTKQLGIFSRCDKCGHKKKDAEHYFVQCPSYLNNRLHFFVPHAIFLPLKVNTMLCGRDRCSSGPCQNGGSCTNFLNRFNCRCSEDYTGLMCETDMCEPSSHNGADVVFVLDTSKSQTNSSFRKQNEYIKDFISNFPIGPTEFQFSVVSVSLHAKVHFYLNSIQNISSIKANIDSISICNSASYTDKAFQVIREDVLSNSKSLRAVPKYVIVLSDGLSSNAAETIRQANLLKIAGVNIIVVAIGEQILHGELQDTASHSSKVFPASNTDAIYSIMKAHVMPACPDCFSNTSDVAILIDISKDLSIYSFYAQLDALRTLLKALPISDVGVHVSFTRFADQVIEDFGFASFTTKQDVIVAVSSSSSKGQMVESANLSKALDHVLQNTFNTSKGRRSNARKVLLLFISGIVSNTEVCKEKSQRLKDSGVTIVTVSIGLEINMTSLLAIASDPAFVYVLGDDVYTQYDVLYALIGTLEYDVCEFD